ncbi:MAG: hypothetical protein F4X57_10225 [Chloroflexi bacterium]|nr:hypothetical protein [Chloroflexota bacterium]
MGDSPPSVCFVDKTLYEVRPQDPHATFAGARNPTRSTNSLTDTFLLGAGFSKAVSNQMPTMKELYNLLEGLIGQADGFNREVYEYASGNAETLLSYYAIPGPHDDPVEALRKRRVTALIEIGIGETIRNKETRAELSGLNPSANILLEKWHQDRSHILTTNYDTLVERIASQHDLFYTDLFPVPITNATVRDGGAILGSEYPDTFTLYKLHGSTAWYKSQNESTSDSIYGLPHNLVGDPKYQKFVADKRRFIVPPVLDKSSLLNHETIRNLWSQAKQKALIQADNIYVIGYSLPETDIAMRTLLWEGTRTRYYPNSPTPTKSLYVVDIDNQVARRFKNILGAYYHVYDRFTGSHDMFDKFVAEYVGQ